MKKRTLLILALGISFTPAVFAVGPLGEPVEQLKPGQTSFGYIQEHFPEAGGCNLRDKKIISKQSANSQNKSGNDRSTNVGSAR